MNEPCRWSGTAAPVLALGLALGLVPLRADPVWERLESPALEALLTGAEVAFDGIGWQQFLATGRVLTRSGEAPSGATSWADWRVERDSYCARMPDATEWECYWVEVDGAGGIRFTDAYGNVSTGRLVTVPGAGSGTGAE